MIFFADILNKYDTNRLSNFFFFKQSLLLTKIYQKSQNCVVDAFCLISFSYDFSPKKALSYDLIVPGQS